ncbi:MAG: D-alanyl-D-alanine carboxypeptidase [Lachnospiraceae bacterium]|nr:D-alanyl-D-alanine carboxypeptidase [Lachnospiraceae bacterium]
MLGNKKRGTRRMSLIFLCLFLLYTLSLSLHSAVTAYGTELPTVSGEDIQTKAVSEGEAGEGQEEKEEEKQQWIWEEIVQERTARQDELRLYARSAILLDASNNRVLYEKNAYDVMPMASTTKIMTAILALEYGNLEDHVTVSKRAASMPKVHLGMKEGETYLLKDLLFSLMLESHNDSAVAIAEHIGGSVEGFADMMNQKARDLGCDNTWFITPNGLDAAKGDKVHSTTAYDLAKIAAYAVQNDMFVALVGTQNYHFNELESGRGFTVNNKDQFLHMMKGAIGIKTGFTNNAGYCFVGAVRRDDRTLISVVLASGWPPNKSYKWTDTRALMEMGVENYTMRNIEAERIPKTVSVKNGVAGSVPIAMEWKDISLLMADWDEVKVTIEIKEELTAPVEENETIGYERVYINDRLYAAVPIETADSVEEYTYRYCLIRLLHQFFYGDIWGEMEKNG